MKTARWMALIGVVGLLAGCSSGNIDNNTKYTDKKLSTCKDDPNGWCMSYNADMPGYFQRFLKGSYSFTFSLNNPIPPFTAADGKTYQASVLAGFAQTKCEPETLYNELSGKCKMVNPMNVVFRWKGDSTKAEGYFVPDFYGSSETYLVTLMLDIDTTTGQEELGINAATAKAYKKAIEDQIKKDRKADKDWTAKVSVTCDSCQKCKGNETQCVTGMISGAYECTDVMFDDQNCGGCGKGCSPGYKCNSGTCRMTCDTDGDCGDVLSACIKDTAGNGTCRLQCTGSNENDCPENIVEDWLKPKQETCVYSWAEGKSTCCLSRTCADVVNENWPCGFVADNGCGEPLTCEESCGAQQNCMQTLYLDANYQASSINTCVAKGSIIVDGDSIYCDSSALLCKDASGGVAADPAYYCANVFMDRDNCGACGAKCNRFQSCENGKIVDTKQGERLGPCTDNGSCTDEHYPNLVCQDGMCVDCGILGLPCCDFNGCDSDWKCSNSICIWDLGSDQDPACGLAGQPCCNFQMNNGSWDGECFGADLHCYASGTSSECAGVSCGRTNQPCCPMLNPLSNGWINASCASVDHCEYGLSCISGSGSACGDAGQECCQGTKCKDQTRCIHGACLACGGLGEPCCDNACNSDGLSCQVNSQAGSSSCECNTSLCGGKCCNANEKCEGYYGYYGCVPK